MSTYEGSAKDLNEACPAFEAGMGEVGGVFYLMESPTVQTETNLSRQLLCAVPSSLFGVAGIL